MQKPQYFHSSM